MVTTIKITCDGVFIQSNPYFTNAHLRQSDEASVGQSSSTSSSSSSLSTDISNELHRTESARTTGFELENGTDDDDQVIQSIPMVESGNMTVVIRNNRKKIGRSMKKSSEMFRDSDPEDPIQGMTNCDKVQEGVRQAACIRPSYHYMYMVRKVPANRALIANNQKQQQQLGSAEKSKAALRGRGSEEEVNDDNKINGVKAEEEEEADEESQSANASSHGRKEDTSVAKDDHLRVVMINRCNGEGGRAGTRGEIRTRCSGAVASPSITGEDLQQTESPIDDLGNGDGDGNDDDVGQ